MTIVILIGLFLLLGMGCCFLIDACFLLNDFLNHTIFKEKYKNKLIKEINNGIKFNSLKISIYKGEKKNNDNFSEEDDYCAIYRYCPSEFYLSEGIDKELIEEFKNSELEAKRQEEIYSEKIRKENLQQRVEFLKSEIKDIKKRI
ncbi:hypothetical protein DVV91_10250 [Clostridium botulinum]|uniref:DUF5320 domain-containing protein n=1 Tax=Clostridium botulinum TaxID=1491 RepID=UPI0019683AEA|nr:DUF5320 domain-containing protein [Clostridium botulinum]MBN1074723.1 hypothetical protein [Clostridium botulinum]